MRTYPPDIHRWIDLFRRVPARTSVAKDDLPCPIATMLAIGESEYPVSDFLSDQLQKDAVAEQKSTDTSGDLV
jgi:hypothetical protein